MVSNNNNNDIYYAYNPSVITLNYYTLFILIHKITWLKTHRLLQMSDVSNYSDMN